MTNLRVLLFSLILLLIACQKDLYPDDCAGFSAGLFTDGYAYAEGSYEDFGQYATFTKSRTSDTINGGWIHHEYEKGILLASVSETCREEMLMVIDFLDISTKDTILLGKVTGYPEALLFYKDIDAILEIYELLDNGNNWIMVESINCDGAEIQGKFNVSFVTKYEEYLNGERERWDDPNRPDTLHFTNGEFKAVFKDY